MTCPDLQQLSRYQDGGLDEQTTRLVREHLLRCQVCQERFRMLGRLGLFWHIGLGRPRNTPCLSSEEVGAYLAGQVAPDERKQIEAHLAGCKRCLHEVAVFSDRSLERLTPSSPVPTRRALAEFAKLGLRPARPGRFQRALVFSSRVAVRVAAAVLVAALLIPLTVLNRSTTIVTIAENNSDVETSATVIDLPVVEASFLADPSGVGETLVSDQSSLARFARQMRLILQQTTEAADSPTEERVGLLQEDVLNSGLVNSIEELSSEITDPRTRRFLIDCRCVLLKVVRLNKSHASDDLIMLVNELRQMNLTEAARLIELEGGGSLWLTASL